MGFNSAFKGLNHFCVTNTSGQNVPSTRNMHALTSYCIILPSAV